MDEIFEDKDGGGYWASEEDELVLVRMKDSQVGPLLHELYLGTGLTRSFVRMEPNQQPPR
jgi:hypothetical protein